MPESTQYYSTLNRHIFYSIAQIQQMVVNLNSGRVGKQVELYSKHVNATNMGLAKLMVFPDNSGIYFKERGPNTDQYKIESDVKNITKSIESAKESGKIDQSYQYKNSAGQLVGGNNNRNSRKISRKNSRKRTYAKSRKY
jgi:hypothetical protein